MKLLAVIFAVLAVVLMTTVPVFGNLPQCEPTAGAAQGGSYPITELMRKGKINYNTARRG
ncbi:uncharacterized protein LOC6732342 [Drosophila simulans]|uniref:GD21997 n=1 Tax=Drosophila simulans TaxID=7240 RepID=B4Q5K6_DROSI|nr:uncharacterized protein LOC6732342 [Drosophila simulans]EDX05050.1 GD21997 [Drosophila simulans]KMY90264.1 uncharacterized protein Dsimw501_GD21997 [Drosophila simulans]